MTKIDFKNIPVGKLNSKQAESELKRLSSLILIHNKNYYQDNYPKISDREYDLLWKRNVSIEKKFPELIRKDSPSLRIGGDLNESFKKVKHIDPMLSLSNIFDESGLNDFYTQMRKLLELEEEEVIEIVAEPKIDGISASLRYLNGDLSLGSTRGNGFEGEDITNNLKVVNGVPKKLKEKGLPPILEIRGEVYMEHRDFTKLNEFQKKMGKPLYANPRNSAAGSLRQLDSNVTAERNLHFFAYTWGSSSNYFKGTQWQSRKQLKELGFIINEPSRLCKNSKEVLNYYEEILDMRSSFNFDIDGVVYKLNNIDWQNIIGSRSRSPRWAVAHKLPAEKAQTVINSIDVQVGRTGSLTPVARLDPINVGGVFITNATLHNGYEIQKKDIREGDTVIVQRAGDVIPQVLEVVISKRKEDSKKYKFPKICPECGSSTLSEKLENGENEKTIRCTGGLKCPSQIVERIKHFVSQSALNIEGFGEKQIKFFLEKKVISDFKDIFLIEERNGVDFDDLSNEQGWGKLSVQNLFQSIEKSRNVDMERLIYGLGIRHIGLQTAKLLSNNYLDMNSLINEAIDAQNGNSEAYNKIILIDGVGAKIGYSIVNFFSNIDNIKLVKELLKFLIVKNQPSKNKISKLSKKIFVFTGSLETTTRSQAKLKVEKLDATVSNSVTSKTDYLVIGSNPGSKIKKAKDLGIKILTENEWMELINNIN